MRILAVLALAASASAQVVTFEPRVDTPITSPSILPHAAVGDVDGDGDLDVVTTGNLVELLENLGDGSFAAPATLATGGGVDIDLADVTGDGVLDAVRTLGDVVVSVGKGDGTFGANLALGLGSPTLPMLVEIADFTGDARPDLLIGTAATVGSVTNIPRVLLATGLGDGTFAAPSVVQGPEGGLVATAFAVGRLDDDASLDFVVALESANTGSVRAYLGDGNGNFTIADDVGTGVDIHDVGLADLDGDGVDDLLVGGTFGLLSFLNDGDADFGPFSKWESAPAGELALSDFDLDGHADVAFARKSPPDAPFVFQWEVDVLRGDGRGGFVPGATVTAFSGLFDLTAGDLDGDGRDDVGFVQFSTSAASFTSLRNHTHLPREPWLDVGGALSSDAVDGLPDRPILHADGTLAGGAPVTMTLARNGVPQTSAVLIIGLSEVVAPFKGGTLVPAPDVALGPLPLPTPDAQLVLTAPMPTGVPPGVVFTTQAWFLPGATGASSATTAVRATTP